MHCAIRNVKYFILEGFKNQVSVRMEGKYYREYEIVFLLYAVEQQQPFLFRNFLFRSFSTVFRYVVTLAFAVLHKSLSCYILYGNC